MSLIEARGLSRTFTVYKRSGRLTRTRTEVRAVAGLDLAIDAGEMVGYIGPNGAGKSTTIKMLTGILVPTGGHLRVAGVDPSRKRRSLAHRIGVVFGQRTTLWWDLPLRDSFELLQKIYRVPPDRFRTNLAEFVELLDLATCWTPRCASSASASGCEATSPPPSCTIRRSCISTSRPSGWTWSPRAGFASSCAP
jgi:ABC-2 type transport system ATP-binding protein